MTEERIDSAGGLRRCPVVFPQRTVDLSRLLSHSAASPKVDRDEKAQRMQMFSSGKKSEPVTPANPPPPPPHPAAPAPAPVKATESSQAGGVLSNGVSIKGSVKFQKELLIDGEIEGKIDSLGRLTIGKHAKIKGEIQTKSVIVDGEVEGNITAQERCELRAGCKVHGDIESPRLVVDEAAAFIGSAKIATHKPGSA